MPITLKIGDKVVARDNPKQLLIVTDLFCDDEFNYAAVKTDTLDELLETPKAVYALEDITFFSQGYTDKPYFNVGEIVMTRSNPEQPLVVIDSWQEHPLTGKRDLFEYATVRAIDRSEPPKTLEAYQLILLNDQRYQHHLLGVVRLKERYPGWIIENDYPVQKTALSPILPFETALSFMHSLMEITYNDWNTFQINFDSLMKCIYGDEWLDKKIGLIQSLNPGIDKEPGESALTAPQLVRLYIEYKTEFNRALKSRTDTVQNWSEHMKTGTQIRPGGHQK